MRNHETRVARANSSHDMLVIVQQHIAHLDYDINVMVAFLPMFLHDIAVMHFFGARSCRPGLDPLGPCHSPRYETGSWR
jgi:hypothetical protein